MSNPDAQREAYNDGYITYQRVTVTTASPGIFLRKLHGLSLNDRVTFDTEDTLPTGLSLNTWYFIISGGLTNDEFEVSATKGGSAVNITGAGSGAFYFAVDRPRRLSITRESTR